MPTFPKLAEYLGQLPAGISSYPQVLGTSAGIKQVLKSFPFKPHDELPAVLNEYLRAQPTKAWLPNVHLFAMVLLSYDVLFSKTADLAGWDKWLYQANQAVFTGPFYRLLFTLVTPKMLIDGAQKRWANFNVGITLQVVEQTASACMLELKYPPGLLNAALVPHHFPQAFRCLFELAGAKDVYVGSQMISPECSRYWQRWQR